MEPFLRHRTHSLIDFSLRLLLLLALAVIIGTTARAQQPSYLTEMPSADRVVSDMRTGSARESAVRASIALDQLANMVQYFSGAAQKRTPLPEEAAKIVEYQQKAAAVFQTEEAKTGGQTACANNDCDFYRLNRCSSSYTFSAEFRREILDRYFSQEWQSQYGRRFASASGDVWRKAMTMPVGTKATLASDAKANCADGSALSSMTRIANSTGNWGEQLGSIAVALGTAGVLLALLIAVGATFVAFVIHQFKSTRGFVIKKNNREAMEVFGSGDQSSREQAIIDAFDSPDYTFRYAGSNGRVTRLGVLSFVPIPLLILFGLAIYSGPFFLILAVPYLGWRMLGGRGMEFVLLRNIKSFTRGDLESMRFGYLAFNRGIIDDEKFHWYRFTAIYGGGKTDPAEWKFPGLFTQLKSKHGDIDRARSAVKSYASGNAGTDIESQALATIQRLALENPQDPLYQDMRRRFVEGAYWLTQGELKRTVFEPSDSPYVIRLGVLDGTNTELVFSAEGSIMTIAPPGAGKTQCNVFPNLLRWPGPAVVLDVKGEIYDGTSAWRAANVGPVIKFSPLDPMRSARFNPMSGVRSESMYLWEDARFLADMMIVPKAKEPFWEEKAKELLTAIIADVAFWNPPDDRAMSKVLSLVNRNGWNEFVDRMRKNPDLETIRDEGSNLANMDARTLDGALQTAKASLSAWVGERISMVTRQSDWHPMDLRNGTNPTLYVCVKPNEIEAYLSLLRVVIAQHIRALTSELPPRGAAPILFVLDELPRLRQMPPVEEALEVGRQYGIKLWMFAQSVGQMKNAYPNGEGMMGSCAVRTFMNPSLQDGTAKMIAEQIGNRSGEEHGGKDKIVKENALVVEPSQLAGVEFKELQIVMGVGSKPAKVRKMYAHADPTLKARMGTVQQEPYRKTAAT